jgi:hypothetical protein
MFSEHTNSPLKKIRSSNPSHSLSQLVPPEHHKHLPITHISPNNHINKPSPQLVSPEDLEAFRKKKAEKEAAFRARKEEEQKKLDEERKVQEAEREKLAEEERIKKEKEDEERRVREEEERKKKEAEDKIRKEAEEKQKRLELEEFGPVRY